ncbi:MAG TPA: hypothetical protein VGO93_08960 [Candidatus Xenobia bacterium]|jgi:hypothetical protein
MIPPYVRQVADAVLWEGYVLYPYRASSGKNEVRFQFGVVMPPGQGESSHQQSEVLLDGDPATVQVHVRFLHLQHRMPDDWDEAVEQVWERPFKVGQERVRCEPWEASEGEVHRTRWPVLATLGMALRPAGPGWILTVRVENDSPTWPGQTRRSALRQALVGCHLVLTVPTGRFVSILEPPPEWADHAAQCRQEYTFPVLVGDDRAVLASPIILYDHPKVAPQSPVAYHDGTEIDEMLTLRVMTLTDAEKQEALATDERCRSIVEAAGRADAETLERLHGGMVWLDGPAPETRSVVVDGVTVAAGTRVRLRPKRNADAMDMFLAGREAEVVGVFQDVEGLEYVAVSTGDDWHGRPYFFYLDEIELMEGSIST